MADLRNEYPALKHMTHDFMKGLLTHYQGNSWKIAEYTGVPHRRIRGYIRADPALVAHMNLCLEVAKNEAATSSDSANFAQHLAEYTKDLALTGLAALEEIATTTTMKHQIHDGEGGLKEVEGGLNAAAMKVRADAAAKLAALAPIVRLDGSQGTSEALDRLNELYSQHAPRIREIRQTTTTVTLASPEADPERAVIVNGEEMEED